MGWPGNCARPTGTRQSGTKSRPITTGEVVCDYNEVLLSHKDNKAKYEATGENQMGYMCEFHNRGTTMWYNAADEVHGPGLLINHSRCHVNVSISIRPT